MPFSVKYDVERESVAIAGSILPNEVTDFERQYLDALGVMRSEAQKKSEPARKKRANWHGLFDNIIDHAVHFAPPNNEYNTPDPYGFKDVAVRMWRAISQASFVDAKQYIESLIKGADRPNGTEHGDIPDDAVTETSRLFDEAKRKVN